MYIGDTLLRIAKSPANARFTVARTPSKLTELLLSKGVSQSAISAHLSVTQGDVRDVGAVKSTLSPSGQTASIVISGIGEQSLRFISSSQSSLKCDLTPGAQEPTRWVK